MLTWTDDMDALEHDPELDAQARAAVVAAAEYVSTLPAGATREQVPYWSLGNTAAPRNAPARAMEAAILAHVTTTATDRYRIVARAARWGMFVFARGGGEQGWAALRELRRAG